MSRAINPNITSLSFLSPNPEMDKALRDARERLLSSGECSLHHELFIGLEYAIQSAVPSPEEEDSLRRRNDFLANGKSLVAHVVGSTIEGLGYAEGHRRSSDVTYSQVNVDTWLPGISVYTPTSIAERSSRLALEERALLELEIPVAAGPGINPDTIISSYLSSATAPRNGYYYRDRDQVVDIVMQDSTPHELRQSLQAVNLQPDPRLISLY